MIVYKCAYVCKIKQIRIPEEDPITPQVPAEGDMHPNTSS